MKNENKEGVRAMEFRTVCISGNHEEFDKAVNELLKQGFQLSGPLSTCCDSNTVYFTQALIRPVTMTVGGMGLMKD